MLQLQLKKWPACHSLFLNLHRLHKSGELTLEQMAETEEAARKAATLHCLHIISRPQVPLMDSSVEAVLVRHLAEHASVMTLQVRTLTMPLDFPKLQHLVLDLGAFSHTGAKSKMTGDPYSLSASCEVSGLCTYKLLISLLKSLRTSDIACTCNTWS